MKHSIKEEDFAQSHRSCACECDDIKNYGCCCKDYMFIIKDFDFDKISVYERSCQDIFIYQVAYKTVYCEEPLRISFDKIYG